MSGVSLIVRRGRRHPRKTIPSTIFHISNKSHQRFNSFFLQSSFPFAPFHSLVIDTPSQPLIQHSLLATTQHTRHRRNTKQITGIGRQINGANYKESLATKLKPTFPPAAVAWRASPPPTPYPKSPVVQDCHHVAPSICASGPAMDIFQNRKRRSKWHPRGTVPGQGATSKSWNAWNYVCTIHPTHATASSLTLPPATANDCGL